MSLKETFRLWTRVVTSPGEGIFIEEEKHENASLGTAILWIVIAAVIIALFAIIGVFIQKALGAPSSLALYLKFVGVAPDRISQILANIERGVTTSILSGIVRSLLLFPLVFLITSGIYWLIARAFGGRGSFGLQSYMMASYFAPLMIVNAVLALFPLIGAFLGLLVSLYVVVLNYFAIKVAHKLEPNKALLTILLPYILAALFLCCIFLATGAYLSSLLGS